MKLDHGGFKSYNLQNAGIIEKNGSKEITIVNNPKRTILAEEKSYGFYCYDEPLFYSPPVFPYLINFSHHLFSPGDSYYYLIPHNSIRFHQKEFYANIIPFLFSLLTIILLYIFCVLWFDLETGLLASLLLSVSPINILCAGRLWSDSALTFFMFGALLFFLLGVKKNNLWITLLGGILSGLAVLTKVSGLFVIFTLGIYVFAMTCIESKRKSKFTFCLELKHYLLLLLMTLSLSLPWFMLVFKTFGNPLHFPSQPHEDKVTHWHALIYHRPWYTYTLNIILQNPLWILALGGILMPFKNRNILLLLTLWTVELWFYLSFIWLGKENRYMLPTYPALAILTAFVSLKLSNVFPKIKILLGLLLLVHLMYSTHMGIHFIISSFDEFLCPV